MLLRTAAVLARLALSVGVISKRQQRRRVVVGDEPDTSAITAVAAIGTALGDVCFTTKRHAARAAIATLDIDVALVNEIGHRTTLPDKSASEG